MDSYNLYLEGLILLFSCSVMSDSLGTPWPTRLLCPWEFPSKNTRVGCHFLLHLDRITNHKDVIYVQVNKLNAIRKNDSFLFWAGQFDHHVLIETKHTRVSRKTWKGEESWRISFFWYSSLHNEIMSANTPVGYWGESKNRP